MRCASKQSGLLFNVISRLHFPGFPFLTERVWTGVFAVLFASIVWLLLPSMVVAMDDDFWYLRSLLQTYQKGQPWTDEWLTPWAASTSVISSLLFVCTGSFTTAVHLTLAGSAGAAVAGMLSFLRGSGFSRSNAAWMAFLVMGTPTVMFMFLMFTSVAVYWACLWVCLYSAKREQWWLFGLVWALALSGRQSAVVWLAIPGMELISLFLIDRPDADTRHKVRSLAGVLSVCFLWLLLMVSVMNETRAQKIIMEAMTLDTFQEMLKSSAMGVLFGGVGLGLASFFRGGISVGFLACSLRLRRTFIALAAVMLSVATMVWFIDATHDTHDCFRDPLTYWVLPIVAGVSAACLVLAPLQMHRGCLAAGTGSLALVALYRGTFDYYFVDVFFFGLAAGLWNSPAGGGVIQSVLPGPKRSLQKTTVRLAGVLLVGVISLWTARSWIRLAVDQNRTAALIQIYEKALDEGLIKTNEIGTAPFGYLGWIYSDCYSKGLDGGQGQIGGFLSMAHGWDGEKGTGVLMWFPKPLSKWRSFLPTRNNMKLKSSEGRVVLTTEYPILGPLKATFELKLVSPETLETSDSTTAWERVSFPLSDEDWTKLLSAGSNT